MDKLYKTVLATVTAASVLVCSACAGAPAADQVQDPDAGKTLPEMTEKITIPASIFKFANTDIEDNMEAFEDYCTDVRRDGDDLILEVTPTQKEELIEMYAGSIDDVLEDMEKRRTGLLCRGGYRSQPFHISYRREYRRYSTGKDAVDDHDIGCPDRNHGNRGSKLECQRKDRELPYGADCR